MDVSFRFAFPILDGHYPHASQMKCLLKRLPHCQGNGFIHCAEGHGRTAMVAAALLIARGEATDLCSAESIILRARPLAKMNRAQKAFLKKFIEESFEKQDL